METSRGIEVYQWRYERQRYFPLGFVDESFMRLGENPSLKEDSNVLKNSSFFRESTQKPRSPPLCVLFLRGFYASWYILRFFKSIILFSQRYLFIYIVFYITSKMRLQIKAKNVFSNCHSLSFHRVLFVWLDFFKDKNSRGWAYFTASKKKPSLI